MNNIAPIGMGTWKLTGSAVPSLIAEAIALGYRHIDTALVYGNEELVGEGRTKSAVAREDLWITTKVWFDYFPQGHANPVFTEEWFRYTQLKERFAQSLKKLKTDYLDLVLLHRPTSLANDIQAFDQLLSLKKEGLIRYIWISNAPLAHLQAMYEQFWSEIYTNQIEWHPCLHQPELVHFAKEKKLILTAYSPLGQGNLLSLPELASIADKHQKTIAQVCIQRLLQQGAVVIPKASSKERLAENLAAADFSLDQEDLVLIDSLPKNHRYCSPPFAPEWDV